MSRIQIPDVELSRLLEFDAAKERYRIECDRAGELRLKRMDSGEDERELVETDIRRLAALAPEPNIKSLSELRQFLDLAERLIEKGLDSYAHIASETERYEKAVKWWLALARHFAPSMLKWPTNLNPSEGLARMLAHVDNILRGSPKRLTVAEAAVHCGRNERTIRRWCKSDKLPGADDSTGQWLIPETSLPAKREPRTTPPAQSPKPRHAKSRWCNRCEEEYPAVEGRTHPKCGRANTEPFPKLPSKHPARLR